MRSTPSRFAVWASEYVRKRIGYGWWRRLHYLSFVVFLLGALHGTVAALIVWRLVRAIGPGARALSLAVVGAAVAALAVFTAVGPAQAGWNEIANGGQGSGASAAWLAEHPAADMVPAAPGDFAARFDGALVAPDRLAGRFASEGGSGTLELVVHEESGVLSLAFDTGWTCSGPVRVAIEDGLEASCSPADGASVQIVLDDLRREGNEIAGELQVRPAG